MRWILLLIVLAILFGLAKVFISGVITGVQLTAILSIVIIIGLIIWYRSKSTKNK